MTYDNLSEVNTHGIEIIEATPTYSRKEYILNMRNKHVEQIQKCRKIINNMMAAINRQLNISIHVKTTLKELEEQV